MESKQQPITVTSSQHNVDAMHGIKLSNMLFTTTRDYCLMTIDQNAKKKPPKGKNCGIGSKKLIQTALDLMAVYVFPVLCQLMFVWKLL